MLLCSVQVSPLQGCHPEDPLGCAHRSLELLFGPGDLSPNVKAGRAILVEAAQEEAPVPARRSVGVPGLVELFLGVLAHPVGFWCLPVKFVWPLFLKGANVDNTAY